MSTAARDLAQRFPARRALVTGAASGLGLACAELLAREGWHLALSDVDAARLGVAAEGLAQSGRSPTCIACDVRDDDAVRAMVDAAAAALGGIDIAIHCAGVATAGAFHSGTSDDWRWVFDINVHGLASCCRAVLPHMIGAGAGLVINVASAASFCTNAKMSSYNAAKAAVVALSETLVQEYSHQGVQTLVAMPGFFRTRLLESARGPQRSVDGVRKAMQASEIEAGEVAEAMLAAAAGRRTYFVYPSRIAMLWRLKRLMPQRFQTLLPRLL